MDPDGSFAAAIYTTRAPTTVFWDVEDLPVPEGHDLGWFREMIIAALAKMDYRGPVTIMAYGDKKSDHELNRYKDAQIIYVSKEHKEKRLEWMLMDITLWTLDYPDPCWQAANSLVISRNIQEYTEFDSLLNSLTREHFNVLLVLPDDYNPKVAPIPRVKVVWYWRNFLSGGETLSWDQIDYLISQGRRRKTVIGGYV